MNRSDKEMRAAIASHLVLDRIVRGARWLLWLALVFGLVLPLAWLAYKQAGAVVALVMLALLGGLTWEVKPQGPSYARRCRDVAARYPVE